ncbi:MAG: hydantoinase/oxoprolinase family protein [Syntrophobacterales bacterium]|jgi:N-methylhydantoinase A/oxoprolinase/acetone carboxylase beta subunit|nr:hydantoinase/oxoprolinase family protein [Syntrophobacterales bacterium]
MLIGIDVGGTYTDGVLFSDGAVLQSVKRPTNENNLTKTLLAVLDELLVCGRKDQIKRVVLGTTLVTNLLATGRGERTALLLLPGSGLPYSSYRISPDTFFLKGSVDFRGREIERPESKEIEAVLHKIEREGIERVAVAGKFSSRNNRHEMLIREIALTRYPHMDVCISSEITGRLNFPRRAVTTYYTAMTIREWGRFADEIETAISARIPNSELHILKADGGTTTLEASRKRPCETVFSGPAASTMGTVALTGDSLNSVMVDIGGTTSDICLLIEGQPLYASRGAVIKGRLTHINSFAVNSIALGGDSVIYDESGNLRVGPMRLGPAACLGGDAPTVTDAFNILKGLNIGDMEASKRKLKTVARPRGESPEELGAKVADHVVKMLKDSIQYMFGLWEDEPAYKVWEVVNRKKFVPQRIIGIGAAAQAIVPMLAEELKVSYFLHRYSPVANALGAAVARPTLSVQVHVDTQNKTYSVSPGGFCGAIDGRNYQMGDAIDLARKHLKEISQERGLSDYADEGRVYLEEQFNIIRGMGLAGKLFDVGIQIAPGFIREYNGVAE